jgi:hypothetical protein
LIRVGVPNAAHKVYLASGEIFTHFSLPSGTQAGQAQLAIGPGAVVYPPELLDEIARCDVSNALDPPLFPEVADVAVAVNLLDTVRNPLSLVGQLDAILAPSGLLVITTPLSWNEEITPPEEALGGGTAGSWARLGTPAGLVELLSGRLPLLPYLRYEILEQTDVPWTVREHARMVTTYEVHVLVARKLEG